jgi:hypothetical protein
MSTAHGFGGGSNVSAPRYEFTADQNTLIGSLAGKMTFVGFFAIFAGLINLLMAIFLTAAIYQNRIPQEWKDKTGQYLREVRDKLPENLRVQAEEYSLDKLPPNNQLWGITLNTLAVSVFLLLLGAWTRSAGDSFRKIVETKGADVQHLMEGLASLHGMYSLFYSILLILLLVGVVSLVFSLFRAFSA